MLRVKLERRLSHPDEPVHAIFKLLSPAQIVDELRHQLEAFWRGEWPFDQQASVKDGNSLGWWEAFSDHPHAHVLAQYV